MRLNSRKTTILNNEYVCELTKELDSLTGLTGRETYSFFHHYIYADNYCKEKKCLALRIPGGTIGGILVDDNNVITKIAINDYASGTYSDDVNELIQKFVGEVIEY